MSFFQKYELLRLLHEGEAKTFKALERASGRNVLFHMLPGDQNKPGSLLERAQKLRGSAGLIEVGEFANSPYVVTEYSENLTKLSEWLASRAPADAAAPSPARRPAVVAPGIGEDVTARLGELPARSPAYEPARAKLDETGEFTREFSSGLDSPRPAHDSRVPAPGAEAGEFTRPLERQPQQATAAPAASAPTQPRAPEAFGQPEAGPGEFTRLFEERFEKAPSPPPAPSTPRAPEPFGQPEAEAGEFTRLFEERFEKAPSPPPAPSPPRAPEPFSQPEAEAGEFTRLFEERFEKAPSPPPAPSPPRAPEPFSQPEAEAGEFTRLFEERFGKAPSPPPAPSTPRAPEPFEKPAADDFSSMFENAFEQRQKRESPAAPEGPSDFTKFFGPGMRSEPINIEEEQARQALNPEPFKQPFRQPSEFTKRFGPAAGEPEEALASDRGSRPDWLSTSTDLFGSTPKPKKPMPAENDPFSPEERPPGEYTRVVRLPDAQEQEAAKADLNQPPVTAVGKRRDLAPLIVAGALLAATVVIVLLLVLRGN